VAVDGNVRKSGDASRAWGELSFLFNGLTTLEYVQPKVGYSGKKSITQCMVSGVPVPLEARENPEDRVPSRPGRTHNHIGSLR
jgi:hypothetical protein